MRYIFIFSALLFSIHATAVRFDNVSVFSMSSNSEACSEIKEFFASLEFESIDFPSEQEAGNPLTITMRVKKKSVIAPGIWEEEEQYGLPRYVLVVNVPYQKSVGAEYLPSLAGFLLGEVSEATFSFSQEMGAHIGGELELMLMATFIKRASPFVHCSLSGVFADKIKIHSNDIHLEPPFLRSMSLDRASYAAGDSARVTFNLSQPIKELRTNHFTWDATDVEWPDNSFPDFKEGKFMEIKENEDGSYSIEVEIPPFAKPGKYFLSYFNREDVFGNFESSVGQYDAEELAIREANPMIVAKRNDEL